MFSNKISLKKIITFSHVAKYLSIDNCFTVAIQINGSFMVAIYHNEFLIKISYTEILFQQKQFIKQW